MDSFFWGKSMLSWCTCKFHIFWNNNERPKIKLKKKHNYWKKNVNIYRSVPELIEGSCLAENFLWEGISGKTKKVNDSIINSSINLL